MAEVFTMNYDDETLEYSTEKVIVYDREVTEISMFCPGCNCHISSLTPKCPWEQGGSCARHDALDSAERDQRKIKASKVHNLDGAGI